MSSVKRLFPKSSLRKASAVKEVKWSSRWRPGAARSCLTCVGKAFATWPGCALNLDYVSKRAAKDWRRSRTRRRALKSIPVRLYELISIEGIKVGTHASGVLEPGPSKSTPEACVPCNVNIETAANLMGATTDGFRAELFDKEIVDFSIDSRTVDAGEVFFALSQPDYERAGFNGTFVDGHEFIAGAFAKGAVAAVARRERVAGSADMESLSDRLLIVDDVIAALQRLARKVYEQWSRPVIGITGSAGKTTTKELTAHVLSGDRSSRTEE